MTCIANIRINQETKRKEINYKFAGAISFNVFYLGFLLQNPILSSKILKLLRITKRNKMKSSAVKPFLVDFYWDATEGKKTNEKNNRQLVSITKKRCRSSLKLVANVS